MLKSVLKFTIPACLVIAGLGISTSSSYGKAEYSKKEKKSCTYCHVGAGKKEVNDVGKCYAEHEHSLDTCTPKK